MKKKRRGEAEGRWRETERKGKEEKKRRGKKDRHPTFKTRVCTSKDVPKTKDLLSPPVFPSTPCLRHNYTDMFRFLLLY